MNNDIPIIGEEKPKCSYCETEFVLMDHPQAGKMLAPPCDCLRPVLVGDINELVNTLLPFKSDQITSKRLLQALTAILEGRAKRERGQ